MFVTNLQPNLSLQTLD